MLKPLALFFVLFMAAFSLAFMTLRPASADIEQTDYIQEAIDQFEKEFGQQPWAVVILPPGEYTLFSGDLTTKDGVLLTPGESFTMPQYLTTSGTVSHITMPDGKVVPIQIDSVVIGARPDRQPNQTRTHICQIRCTGSFIAFCEEYVCMCLRMSIPGQRPAPPSNGIRDNGTQVTYDRSGSSCGITWP